MSGDARAPRNVAIWGFTSALSAAIAGSFIWSWGLLFAPAALIGSAWTLVVWRRLPRPRGPLADAAALLAAAVLIIGIGGTFYGAVVMPSMHGPRDGHTRIVGGEDAASE